MIKDTFIKVLEKREDEDIDEARDLVNAYFNKFYIDFRNKARKDKFVIEGNSVDYKDLCKFKVFNNKGFYTFVPSLGTFNGSELKENFKEVDLTTVVNLGIAESFVVLNNLFGYEHLTMSNFLFKYITFSYPLFNEDKTYLKVLKEGRYSSIEYQSEIDGYIGANHLSMLEFFKRFKPTDIEELNIIQDTVDYMNTLASYNLHSYGLLLIDLLSFLVAYKPFLYDFSHNFITIDSSVDICKLGAKMISKKALHDSFKKYYNRYNNNDYESVKFDLKDLLSLDSKYASTINFKGSIKDELSYGSISYRYNDNTGKITDGRIFAISLVGILAYGLLSYSNVGINVINLDYCQYRCNKCLGTDIASGLVTGFDFKFNKKGEVIEESWKRGINPNCNTYEGFVVWKKYNKSSLKYEDFGFINEFSSMYKGTFIHSVVCKYCTQMYNNTPTFDAMKKSEKVIKGLKSNIESLKNEIKTKPKYLEVDTSIIEKKDEEINNLNKKIEELNSIIASKSNIISNMSADIDSLNEDFRKIFNDDWDSDIEDDFSEDVSIEEMVEFLNEFNILFVSGFNELPQRLKERCMTSFSVINTCGTNSNYSNSYKADFVVYHTNYISHCVCNMVKAIYSDSAEQLYYTGLNTDKMISAIYSYVQNYLNK